MPLLDKQKLLAFSKKKAATPLAAGALAAKRAQAQQQQPPPAPPPGQGIPPHPGAHAGPPAGLPPPKPGTPNALGKPPPKVMPLKPPMPPGHAEPHAELPHPGEEQEAQIYELVEDAAQAAEGGLDQELEDTIAGSDSKGPQDVPKWALDPQKWAEAAEAVGLGIEGVQEKYEEPFVVTAYLYKMLGGPIEAAGLPGADGAPAKPAAETDMTKKGAAASALQARAAARPPPG